MKFKLKKRKILFSFLVFLFCVVIYLSTINFQIVNISFALIVVLLLTGFISTFLINHFRLLDRLKSLMPFESVELKPSFQESPHAQIFKPAKESYFMKKMGVMLEISRRIPEIYNGKIQMIGLCNLILTSGILKEGNIDEHFVSILSDINVMGEPDIKAVKLIGKRKNIMDWGCLLYSPSFISITGNEKPGWIYAYTFVVSGGSIMGQGENNVYGMPEMTFVKIGMTTQENPLNRIDQQLGTSNPMPVLLLFLGSVFACRKAEKTLHEKLKNSHLKEGSTGREWFLLETQELKYILLRFCLDWNQQIVKETE
jgi:hypothetical protein